MTDNTYEQPDMGAILSKAPKEAIGFYVWGHPYPHHVQYVFREDIGVPFIRFKPKPPNPELKLDAAITSYTSSGDKDIHLRMNARQAQVLWELTQYVGGSPEGPRAVLSALSRSLSGVTPVAPRETSVRSATGVGGRGVGLYLEAATQ